MQGSIPSSPKNPDVIFVRNSDLRPGDYIAICHYCGYVTHGYLYSGVHDRYCKGRRELGLCSVKTCLYNSTFETTKINLCWRHYGLMFTKDHNDPQYCLIKSTLSNGWRPKCRVCRENPADLTRLELFGTLMCWECANRARIRRQQQRRRFENRTRRTTRRPSPIINPPNYSVTTTITVGIRPRSRSRSRSRSNH